MKPTAVLVEYSRGPVIDEQALAQALRQGQIFAAGLDVFEREPDVHPGLLACHNAVLIPHLGSATVKTSPGDGRPGGRQPARRARVSHADPAQPAGLGTADLERVSLAELQASALAVVNPTRRTSRTKDGRRDEANHVHGHRYDAGLGWFRPASAPQTRPSAGRLGRGAGLVT